MASTTSADCYNNTGNWVTLLGCICFMIAAALGLYMAFYVNAGLE